MKSSNIRWIFGAIVVIVVVVVLLVTRSNGTNLHKEIRVGVILPLTGQYGSLGESVKNGMEMGLRDLGSSTSVRLMFEDDGYDSKTALSAYRKLTDTDHADIIVSFGSPTVEVTKPLVNKSNQIMFLLGDELSHEVDRVFEVMPQGAGLFGTLGTEVSKSYQSVSIVYASDSSLFTMDHDLFVGGLLQGVSRKDVSVQSGSDMKTEAAEVIASKMNAFTLFVPVETGIKFLKQLIKYPVAQRPKLICDMNISLSIQQYISAVGTSIFEGCLSTNMADTKTTNFVDKYKMEYSSEPLFGSDLGYDAVKVIGQLSKLDQGEWMNALNSGFQYSGASGNITFDSMGTRPSFGEVVVYKNGKFVKLEE